MAKRSNTLSRDPIRSLAEFIDRVEQVVNFLTPGHQISPWFRGQGNSDWLLVPKIYRSQFEELIDYEEDFRDDFKQQAWSYLAPTGWEPTNSWEWYFLMQHYGIPTRLLDWTESSLIALYFAINDVDSLQARAERKKSESRPKRVKNAAVWALDPGKLNRKVAKKRDRIFSLSDREIGRYLSEPRSRLKPAMRPIAIQPPHKSHRIAAQQGFFTVHGTSRKALETYPSLKRHCVKIEIDVQSVSQIREQLRTAGIAETTVFPELSGLAKELVDYWSYVHPV